MAPEHREAHPNDALLYRSIIRVLSVGFWVALALIAAGLLLAAARGESIGTEVAALRDLPDAVVNLESQAIVDLGLLTLLVSPLAYVCVALLVFLRGGERRLAGVAAVLLVLVIGTMIVRVS